MDRGEPKAFSGDHTGFSAAGVDFRGKRLRLDDLIMANPSATFFLQAAEECNLGGCIHPGDILVVDRAADISHGSLVVAVVHGEMVLRQVVKRHGRSFLRSSRFHDEHCDQSENAIWGKVIYVLHQVSP